MCQGVLKPVKDIVMSNLYLLSSETLPEPLGDCAQGMSQVLEQDGG